MKIVNFYPSKSSSHIVITFTRPNAIQNPIASNDAIMMISAPCHSSSPSKLLSPV